MISHFDKKDILSADPKFRKNFVNCLSGFKSLNLIGTQSQDGKTNLAPFSQVFHVGATPPLVGILFRPHTVKRHTLENILDTCFFTLNHVTKEFYKEAHQTAARYEESEFKATGIDEEYKNNFPAPFVLKSPLQIGCSLAEHQTLKVNGSVLVIGAIEHVFVESKSLGSDGFLDLNYLGTLTVSGLDEYHVGKKIQRLSYPKPDKWSSEI